MAARAAKKKGKRRPFLHGSAPDDAHSALLIMDLISDFDFEEGRSLLRAALPVARRIRRLRGRARSAGVPVVYVNDNFGRWRSDFRQLVERCAGDGSAGAPVVRMLLPEPGDYFVLKPKHSAFFATPLEILLGCIEVRRLILTGVTSHQCVLFTANDAYLRDYDLLIPRDCIAAPRESDTRSALAYFRRTLEADVRASPQVRFP
jgi:nicotinamidase-related amidase